MDADEKTSKLQTFVAILIAVTTVIGAVIAWRSSQADDAGGDAEFAGLKASLDAAATRSLEYVNAYAHYGVYTAFARNTQLGDALGKELTAKQASADETELQLLSRQQAEAYDLAKASQREFPSRFLRRDGSYDVQREMSEMWADAAREKDLNPDPQYAASQKYAHKANQLLVTLAVLAVALVCFSLVESMGPRLQVLLAGLGTLIFVAGVVVAVITEFGIQ
jgi:hypothetical protein